MGPKLPLMAGSRVERTQNGSFGCRASMPSQGTPKGRGWTKARVHARF